MGMRVYQQPDQGGTPRGSERSQWWILSARESGNVGYVNARGLVDAANILPGLTSGAAGTYGMALSPTLGAYRRYRGVTNAAPAYVTLSPYGLIWQPFRMDALQLFAPPFGEVLIYRELIQTAASGPLPGGHQLAHGFSLVGNLLAGFPQLTTGSWRGIAIVERTADVVLAVKNANPATLIPLPGVSLSASRILVEHRLYAPTGSRIGRYELWLNDALAQTVDGNHPNFPHPALISEGWRFMPFSLNNPGTATTVDLNAWWGEIILGPDSEGTY